MLTTTLITAVLIACSGVAGARPVPALADVSVLDRATGQTLDVHRHGGELWVAGMPGSRYAVVLHNRSATRVLAVLSIDGVNAVSGQTAAWDQRGYVLDPGERAEIRGWRKSQERIAAFEFAALPESYAARTGRPDNVGVIGVALFREAPPPKAQIAPGAAGSAGAPAGPPAETAARSDGVAGAPSRLGTGHGRSESSPVETTRFTRAQPDPDQVVAIRYDSRASLVAMGVIDAPDAWRPRPFPGSLGFVPDPPRP